MLRRSKILGLLLFIVAISVMALQTIYFLSATAGVEQLFGAPKHDLTPIYLMYILVIFVGFVYLFKVNPSRQTLVMEFMVVALAFCLIVPFKFSGIITLAAIALIVLIGWLYPSRKGEQDQT
jgi:hypothetical protein